MMQIVMLIKIIRQHLTSQRGSSKDRLPPHLDDCDDVDDDDANCVQNDRNCEDGKNDAKVFDLSTGLQHRQAALHLDDYDDDQNDTTYEDHQNDSNCDDLQNNANCNVDENDTGAFDLPQ